MPRYFVKDFGGREREFPLEDVLTPDSYHEGGSVERAQAQAASIAQAMGRLLAHCVQTGGMTLDKAKEIAGVYHDVHVVNSFADGS